MFYTDEQKMVYTSSLTDRRYDPLALQRRLVIASNGKLNDHLSVWGDPKATEVDICKAEDALVTAARLAFEYLPVTEEGGFGDAVVLDDLEKFLQWLEGKDLRGRTPQP